jgi:hypothetical protein
MMSKDRVITKEVALILFKLTLFYQRICELFKKEKNIYMDEGNETN